MGNKHCFCPSVCLSVAYIANNSRTQRPKVSHLRCDSHTSFKVKRSKVRVTRPINADTHRAPYLQNGKAYKLQTWYTDGGRRPASAAGAMTSKIKGQGHKVMWWAWAVLSKTNSLSVTKISRSVPPWCVLYCAPVSRSKNQRSGSLAH